MKVIKVNKNEAGQRLDKLLGKYLNAAPKSFLYKMLRKKNITLNGKKASGNEIIVLDDEIKFFLADQTIEKFAVPLQPLKTDAVLDVLYEDEHILIINKPCGMLSQKAKPEDVSLVEHLISYLLANGSLTAEDLKSFHPAVCNRLDRNTSGIVAAGKSLIGLQNLNQIFKDRSLDKYYRCIVRGHLTQSRYIDGYLLKCEKTNKVEIVKESLPKALPIKTSYKPIIHQGEITLLEVKLITGRSHQIRAHLASIGYPIIGDPKYGDRKINQNYLKEFGLDHQLLHAYRLKMPEMTGTFKYLSKKEFVAAEPEIFQKIMNKPKGICGS